MQREIRQYIRQNRGVARMSKGNVYAAMKRIASMVADGTITPDQVTDQFLDDQMRQRDSVGALVAIKDAGGNIAVGWSKCHFPKRKRNGTVERIEASLSLCDDQEECPGDRFTKTRSIEVARGRAVEGTGAYIPNSIAQDVEKFIRRAASYFRVKPEEIVVHGNQAEPGVETT